MPTLPNPVQDRPSELLIQQAAQQALARYEGQAGSLLPILHAIQDALGYIPDTAVPTLVEALQLSRAEIHGVIQFYAHFRDQPAAPVVLEVCRAESCQAMGAEHLAQHAREHLGCDFHGSSANGKVTLEPVYCLGLCAQSPAVMIDGEPYARMTPAKLDELLHAKGYEA
ncbi:formate dehydrogenase subunit gamma [Paralcaligenes ureilyticus]|uniref:Formate dehydrogenase gamma subunit n=1 Tax=Paralcaligenes ureilyticus TaxID=627131 RepID=A0A4R3MBB9_9BURK|nr:formate dehydrogenase subunit gamma [Paralcaligenes ureilyticus]TCT10871.1 formate dehydrogenase gamma subunit [Paralcaligenes ureilyticus]